MKMTLRCDLCAKRLNDPVSLAGIMRDCDKDTTPHTRAKWLVEHIGMPKKTLLCEHCFWGERVNPIKVWLYHLNLLWNGDDKFEKDGCGIIPCKCCGHPFKSWIHYDPDFGFCYDSECQDCQKYKEEKKNGKQRFDGYKREDKRAV